MSNWANHDQMVSCLAKPGEDILKSLTPEKCVLLHAASKLCSEAGELMDAVGKHVFYEQDLDQNNVFEELGDTEFYTSMIRQALLITQDAIKNLNMVKLSKRYPNGYSDEAAKKRADKT
jgi:NTP pyrophosphatase (non-canonical NTP hydrolase)